MGEHRAGLEKGNAKADPAEIGGRLPGHTERARVRELEDIKSDDRRVLVRRGSGDGMGAKEWCRNTGSPCKQSVKAQRGIPRGTGLACVGGGEARSSEEARNERRAKGPQFQGNATSGTRAEIGASLPPAEQLWKLQETLHAKSMKTPWSESRMGETRTSGLMSGGVETGPPKETAPPLDSTIFEKRCEVWQSKIRDGSVAGVGSHKRHNTGESAIEGRCRQAQSPWCCLAQDAKSLLPVKCSS